VLLAAENRLDILARRECGLDASSGVYNHSVLHSSDNLLGFALFDTDESDHFQHHLVDLLIGDVRLRVGRDLRQQFDMFEFDDSAISIVLDFVDGLGVAFNLTSELSDALVVVGLRLVLNLVDDIGDFL
jgi:hypothetical protein